ncbi:helix-turn-helix domain-containing protein [Rhodococcoides kyotonense]|uniref:Helix-turn-helix domain-containing protein n=1 Tax=Rhodococcoides kyotonense TaxID=398843 RepID=A0A239I2R6_9NOCA|nr:helix-turn-helix domain-containing protein [Rhodococcus kyotonensis]SNS87781.1 Helix-turn-helix domain-containing protein [Rhodococcus kyotonensis]
MGGVSDGARRAPSARLRPFLASYDGYRLSGFEPGRHIGMPSPYLTVILAIGEKLEIAESPRQGACAFESLASGISAEPVTIAHDGNQHGIQLSLTPAGARALFGIPTAALGSWMVDLDDVLPDAQELMERIATAASWDSRFDVVDEILCRSVTERPIESTLVEAWHQLVESGGSARVGEVASNIGWSRRHLINRFTAEFGVAPKDAAKISRFHHSHRLMRRPESPRLSFVAAECGYYDQAHMARDWRDLAGVSPSQWRRDEKFTFVQDDDAAEREQSRA